jgi:L-fucono-1,5-lactonase
MVEILPKKASIVRVRPDRLWFLIRVVHQADMVDSHHHLWKYNPHDYVWMTGEMEWLRRDFLITDLKPLMRETGVTGLVTVQARQMIDETEWLLDVAKQQQEIRGVVGWVPLVDEDVGDTLAKFAANPALKGVRHVLHDEPDDDYMLRPDFDRGIGQLRQFGLTYDILIFERHLPQTIRMLQRHPDQVFIVDHIAKPRIRDGVVSPWRERLMELASYPNVFCKVSGMVTEASWHEWTERDLAPYFDVVLKAFGPERLMFGSDWPVLNLASDYRSWVEVFLRLISTLSPHEQARMCGATAVEAYRL